MAVVATLRDFLEGFNGNGILVGDSNGVVPSTTVVSVSF